MPIKENIPIPTYHKINILNKISEARKGMKNLLMNEANCSKFLNHKYKLKQISDFDQTNNEDEIQTHNQTEILSREKKLTTTNCNSYSNQFNEDKIFFSLNQKKYDNKKDNTKYNNNNGILVDRSKENNKINKQINKIDSFGFNGQKIEKNNYKISNQQFNEYYFKKGNIYDNDTKIDNFDEKNDLSIQSLSDSKVFEIANTYVDDHVDKTQVSGILTYKRKQNQIPY